MKHWSEDSLYPALVAGWFSWWIWCRFCIDLYFGAWGYLPFSALYYFNPPEPLLFESLPNMMLIISIIGVVLSIPIIVLRRVWTWQGKVMTLLAHFVILASVVYTSVLHRQEVLSAESTRIYIMWLESQDNRDWVEDEYLRQAKEIYERYTIKIQDR